MTYSSNHATQSVSIFDLEPLRVSNSSYLQVDLGELHWVRSRAVAVDHGKGSRAGGWMRHMIHVVRAV